MRPRLSRRACSSSVEETSSDLGSLAPLLAPAAGYPRAEEESEDAIACDLEVQHLRLITYGLTRTKVTSIITGISQLGRVKRTNKCSNGLFLYTTMLSRTAIVQSELLKPNGYGFEKIRRAHY